MDKNLKPIEPLLSELSKPGKSTPYFDRDEFIESLPEPDIPEKFRLKEKVKLPEVSEPELMRHFSHLAATNHHIEKGIYPLGSCTMKYNPKMNEYIASLPGIQNAHPLLDEKFSQGLLEIMFKLGEALKEISGLDAFTLQPAAGAQGEFTAILMIRAYLLNNEGKTRKKVIIPDSAHGTNPASVSRSGYISETVKSNKDGEIDIEHLKSLLNEDVAAIMITNPNTLGIYESKIDIISELVHNVGGLVYMDGANLNALLGYVKPGELGVDALHINLHKTFSTPHGGGGPGAGPVLVNKKLEPYLPVPVVEFTNGKYRLNYDREKSIGRMQAFHCSFAVIVKALSYILRLGKNGLERISKYAILNANYVKYNLIDDYELPYKTHSLHEFVISGNKQKKLGVKTLDIAKRLLDFNVYAPTIYFPLIVQEALMIEPTETESKESLDEFISIMKQIAKETEENPDIVINAPHNTPVRRLNEIKAAKELIVNWNEIK